MVWTLNTTASTTASNTASTTAGRDTYDLQALLSTVALDHLAGQSLRNACANSRQRQWVMANGQASTPHVLCVQAIIAKDIVLAEAAGESFNALHVQHVLTFQRFTSSALCMFGALPLQHFTSSALCLRKLFISDNFSGVDERG